MVTEEQYNQLLERLDLMSKSVNDLSAKMDSIEGKFDSLDDRIDDLESEIANLADIMDEVEDSCCCRPSGDEFEAKTKETEHQKQTDKPLNLSTDRSGSVACYKSLMNKEINLPDDLLSIRDNSFLFCMNLEHFVIPASVKRIGKEFCFRCLNLKSVKFLGPCPEGLENAFDECWRLKEILVPKSDFAAYQKAIPKHLSSIKAY